MTNAKEINAFTRASSLVERAKELPSILDRIEALESDLKPIQDEIKLSLIHI